MSQLTCVPLCAHPGPAPCPALILCLHSRSLCPRTSAHSFHTWDFGPLVAVSQAWWERQSGPRKEPTGDLQGLGTAELLETCLRFLPGF